MKKNLLILLIIAILFGMLYVAGRKRTCPLTAMPGLQTTEQNTLIKKALGLLRLRKNKEASVLIEQALLIQPDNLQALWGKAELLRRSYHYKEAEAILNKILEKDPKYLAALNSIAYIRYKENKIDESQKIVERILESKCLDRENKALAYLTLGAIYGRRAQEGWLFNKIKYGAQIKSCFEKALSVAPNLAETHLSLGTFYLKAPAIIGGDDLDKAFRELNTSLAIAPDFATTNARLAQAYRKKGNLVQYNFYLNKARALDPNDEALKN